ncbi:serum amyloid A-1 protein-like [Nannospalax galili]|uniref:serum amyloid A-1 protein-like n=1 Tax=Nannospalax galili TaxID=1026970 RepID=UPI0004ED2F89|nr:serum amyloid A-1 protein-like [Nannospalax galili]
MKLLSSLLCCALVLGSSSGSWFSFVGEAAQGKVGGCWVSRILPKISEQGWEHKYFHARVNYDAAQRGPGGAWAAEKISNARENMQMLLGHGHEDSMADQEANRWGRSSKDPNCFRPAEWILLHPGLLRAHPSQCPELEVSAS